MTTLGAIRGGNGAIGGNTSGDHRSGKIDQERSIACEGPMSAVASPDVEIRERAEEDIAEKVRDLFGEDFAVVIMDSDFTTFDEVERACMALFGFSRSDAEALAMRVHTTGEALAAVMPEGAARRAVRELRRRNVLARVEKL